jgi:hypothetical protein
MHNVIITEKVYTELSPSKVGVNSWPGEFGTFSNSVLIIT